jgi:hypothetical protein
MKNAESQTADEGIGLDRREIRELPPGSQAAVKAGCVCPIIDNHYGSGRPGNNGVQFIIELSCPVHGCADARP